MSSVNNIEYQKPNLSRSLAIVQATVFENPWIPDIAKDGLTIKQAEFLGYEGRECFYGGAAGGGKSWSALMGALQYVTEPGYHALIVRKTYKQLAKADSILNISKEWLYKKPGVKWNGENYVWTFPSGSTIEFGHMEGPNDHLNFQGAIWQYVIFDELTNFPEEQQYTFLFTRQRRPLNSPIPIRMRATGNPGGPGHEWVFNRFVNPKTRRPDARFIPAKLDDNPNLDKEDYVQSMDATDSITRAQMLDGDWTAVEGGRFKREWFKYWRKDQDGMVTLDGGERFNINTIPTWQTCDPAASASNQADHFVVSTWGLTPNANLIWLDCFRAQMEIPEQIATCRRLYRQWNPQLIAVEEVLNQRALAQLLRRCTDPAMVVRGVSPLGKDKLQRSTPAMILAESGRVYLPEERGAFPLDEVLGELIRFTGEQGNPDDTCDTLFYAVATMSSIMHIARMGSSHNAPITHDPFATKPKQLGMGTHPLAAKPIAMGSSISQNKPRI